jgi:N-acetylmuramoyl-L-alanine amidase
MTARALAAGVAELDVVALTLEHEAAGEPIEGVVAVGCVLRNRAEWGRWGPLLRDVCLAPAQFSCWQPRDGTANHARLVERIGMLRAGGPDADAFRRRAAGRSYLVAAVVLAGRTLDGYLEDITGGADHYFAPRAMKPRGRVPAWARGLTPTAEIGGHRFYKLRKG